MALSESDIIPKQSALKREKGKILPFKLPSDLPEGITLDNIVDAYPDLNGYQKEGITLHYISLGDLKMVDTLNPDMNALEPLDMLRDDRRVTSWTWQAQNSPVEITPDSKEPYFKQLSLSFSLMSKGDLAALLERERLRRIEFTPGMFAASENLGRLGTQYEFSAARRHFTLLSEYVRFTRETREQEQHRLIMGEPIVLFERNKNSKKAPTPLHP